jgi:competence protein ComEC
MGAALGKCGVQNKVAGFGTALLFPLRALLVARGLLFPWVPMFIGAGIAIWFALPFEPGFRVYLALGAAFVGASALRLWGPELAHPLAIIVGCLVAGGLAAGLRAHMVQAPMLEFHYYGPVQGRVTEIDRAQSDALRITLDQVVLRDVAPEHTPANVRISLLDEGLMPVPGQIVLMTAHLAAPEPPSEPGGFDFRRMAYFDQLGAVGYARSPVMLWAEPAAGVAMINRLRQSLSAALMRAVPGDAGAFSSGVMTGDRSGISLDTVQALRDSNLAHLLAISGMNMAFLTGFVFVLVRYGLALLPRWALRVNTKKIAAVGAFGVALFYLLLSGANVATTRAFLMVCVMLGAVILDRRALTMRSVALAGTVLLLVQPESLLEPGFQLSFAATVVLIAGFGALDRQVMRERLPRWVMPPFTLVLTSVLAGAATAPFAAAHFNRFTDYGLLANLLTVPVMSVLMGAGAVAALLAPFGLAGLALWVMEQCARWILYIAHWIAGLDGAVTAIVAPGAWVLPLITFGGAWVILGRGPIRWAGVVPVAAALLIWTGADRPQLLISSDGRLAGLLGAQGRALSAPRGAGFAAESWLEDDGDLALQADAAGRAGFSGPAAARRFRIGDWQGVILSGKTAAAALGPACAGADIVILPAAMDPVLPRPTGCLVLDRSVLDDSGALAFGVWDGKLHIAAARSVARLWVGPRPVWPEMVLPPPQMRTALQ